MGIKHIYTPLKIHRLKFFYVVLVLSTLSCNKNRQPSDDIIPFTTVDKYYNTTFPGLVILNNPGGWIIDSSAGTKGIFIIKNYSNEYKAFDLNCSYRPLDACSKLTVDSSGLFLKCGKYLSNTWQPCCDSRFGIDGIPTKAPATRVLRQYQVTFDGVILHVFN